MVTSVIMTGSQQLAVIRKFHKPSEGMHAVNKRIELSALMRSVETIVNHKNRLRQ